MKLFLDPSSTCIGYATFTDAGELVSFGRLICRGKSLNDRIIGGAIAIEKLLTGMSAERVVVEDCDGQIGRGARAGGGRNLDLYGKAVGFYWATLLRAGATVEMVPVRTWTRHVAKGKRQMWVAAKYHGRYDPKDDPGGDVADAIALGEWWFTERRLDKFRDVPGVGEAKA